jgi:Metallo-beta-lactamase superfamily
VRTLRLPSITPALMRNRKNPSARPAEDQQNLVTRPAADQVELNLFGPGYGESVLVHLGANRWLIVDSCIDGTSGRPAALEYLDRLGVDASTSVLYLVATHWHDDHVGGFTELVKQCQQARVHFTSAMTCEVLLELIGSDFSEPVGKLVEMTNSLNELKGAGSDRNPDRAYWFLAEHSPVHLDAFHSDGPAVEIWALSPSASDREETAKQLRLVLPGDSRYRPGGLPKPRDNHTSVVLHVRVGRKIILLGADREALKGETRGWNSVTICHRDRGLNKASLYKVAHHGSPNGDDDLIWAELLDGQPVALLAPYRRGLLGGRPRPVDIVQLCQRTSEAYSTSVNNETSSAFDPAYEPVLDARHEFNRYQGYEVEDAQTPFGHLRARANVAGGAWTVEYVPPAGPLCAAGKRWRR